MKISRLSIATVLSALAPLAAGLYQNGSVTAPCDSPIYCYGDLLREIELARPFADSKTFVDL
jgi:alpha,alpha-trehalase